MDEVPFKSYLCAIEECVKHFDILGDNTSDMRLRVTITPPLSFQGEIIKYIDDCDINSVNSHEFSLCMQEFCKKQFDENDFRTFSSVNMRGSLCLTFVMDFTYNNIDANMSKRKFERQFSRLANTLTHMNRLCSVLADTGETGTTTSGFAVFINDTDPELDNTTPDFKIGGRGGLAPRNWTYKTMNKVYAFLSDTDFDESDTKSVNNSTLHLPSGMNPICLQFHKIKSIPVANEHYYYKLIGYRDRSLYEERKLQIFLVLRPRDLNSEYAKITKMCDWVKTFVIDRISDAKGAQVVGSNRSAVVEIRISMGISDFKPVLDWKSKKYDNTYTRAVAGSGRWIEYKVSFHDEEFDRFGRPKRGGNRFLSKQMELAFEGNREYEDDMRRGYFGRYAQTHSREESKIYDEENDGRKTI